MTVRATVCRGSLPLVESINYTMVATILCIVDGSVTLLVIVVDCSCCTLKSICGAGLFVVGGAIHVSDIV